MYKCMLHILTSFFYIKDIFFLLLLLFVYRGSVLAVSSLRCGLLHVSKESALIGDVSHFAYPGAIDPDTKVKIARSLGPINKV